MKTIDRGLFEASADDVYYDKIGKTYAGMFVFINSNGHGFKAGNVYSRDADNRKWVLWMEGYKPGVSKLFVG